MEQYFQQQPVTQIDSSCENIDKWKSGTAGQAGPESNPSGGFDCNICLDLVQEPVVTFCGHLYCWPCIYRWIRSQSRNPDDHLALPQCPVCKADVSENTLIPLYGRGQSRKSSDRKGTNHGLVVPQRPNGPRCGVHSVMPHHPSRYPRQQVHHPYYSLGDYPSSFGFAGTTTYHPMIGMFGEMIYARIFGNSQSTLYEYPNTYSVATTSSARGRRHTIQVDRSLSRVSFFLCCCIILCLLLF